MKSEAQILLEKLHNSTMKVSEQIPDGYYNVEHYAKEWNLSVRQSRSKLNYGVELGFVSKKTFQVNRNGYMKNINYYAKT
ncbi:MAG: hypothetical protein EB127_05935 [Alphaproteobacteria bacterium]|nr:hypothetical protein [Alphaproteobacteria bacterium]